MVKTGWIWSLRKEELEKYLTEFDENSMGSVDELRKRLAAFANKATLGEITEARLTALEAKHKTGGSLTLPVLQSDESVDLKTPLSPRVFESVEQLRVDPEIKTKTIDRVRKWTVRFKGDDDPLEFVARVEELAEMYEVDLNLIPRTMPELLQGDALSWYRNNKKPWSLWVLFRKDFLQFFLPSRFFEQLDDDIRERVQKSGESFKQYVTAIQTLMRHASYSSSKQLERIFRNCAAPYQLYIKRKDFETLAELLAMAEEYERLKPNPFKGAISKVTYEDTRHRMVEATTPLQYDSRNSCWRCGQTGHFSKECRNEWRLFCSGCGRNGIQSRDCCRKIPNSQVPNHSGKGRGISQTGEIENPQ